ncbi:NAD(P)-dependent oxidoreductase [Bordetella sp. FB-8]|uniref:NAD(P)-dependent oxidoreductase n=1 Tax=Bordetella sp. FB-8 TaxID=1159870 RepID=UPI0003734331|nr:NAD(P)-dependent oxidoreductase [Bordetella sp. FB-8]
MAARPPPSRQSLARNGCEYVRKIGRRGGQSAARDHAQPELRQAGQAALAPPRAAILDAGSLVSNVSRVKLTKLVRRDFTRQAGISDVPKNKRLATDADRQAAIATPLIEVCLALYGATQAMDLGEEDMAAVIQAIDERSRA